MGRFSSLAIGQVIEVGGEKFTIKPLRMAQFEFLQNWSEFARDTRGRKLNKEELQTQINLMTELVFTSLNMVDNTITMEDIKELPFTTMMKIIETIMKVNGFSDES